MDRLLRDKLRNAPFKEIIHGQLNPTYLAVAARGYHIQSSVLHIPDRYGWFTPGSPRLQCRQGAAMSFCLFLVVLLTALYGYTLYTLKYVHKRQTELMEWMFGISLAFVVLAPWLAMHHDPRRAPNYEWKDWGKGRKE
ncbi:hypothetical protein CCHR01_07917 [Colletotrichum chrysophilum]|uniref:Uncharacterized protein n=1 Tax=Colletotrichum chrysophilum TaxID=1836956 RepID=A0AAD9AMA6_9PEZI|nr:hypothetical protein K456DRAFT_1727609 [Colletotrichum gloeosporioides 23]KAK1849472.1 hypothetical protein CCHR01_07917 [Colletotrichum chrysophilum]